MRSVVATFALVATLLAVPAQAATPRTATVVLKNIDFSKSSVTIARGGTVTWRWNDEGVSHDVTSRGTKRFKSSATKGFGTHRVRFTRAGTYRYVCTVHFNMTGKVVVRP